MATFTPPKRTTVPAVAADTPSWQQKPAVYFSAASLIPRHANVFKLLDGTYTEKQPADLSTVAVTYYGGHAYTVTSAEAAALTAAGYGPDIT